jgi:hypothetical protein
LIDVRKTWIILAIIIAFALVGIVSANPFKAPLYGPSPINWSYNGNIVLTYDSKFTAFVDEFGKDQPLPHVTLGHVNDGSPTPLGTTFNIGRCSRDRTVEVVLFINAPGGHTFY